MTVEPSECTAAVMTSWFWIWLLTRWDIDLVPATALGLLFGAIVLGRCRHRWVLPRPEPGQGPSAAEPGS